MLGRKAMASGVIGREEELGVLEALLDARAVAHGPTAIALEGEAGIGKSTLWDAPGRGQPPGVPVRNRLPLVIESTVFPIGDSRRTRSYERLSDVREDVADARVWGGLHFRSTMEETPKLGDSIVAHVAAHYFRETRGG